MIIDLNYVKNGQNALCKQFDNEKGIKYQVNNFKVTRGQIIGLCYSLYKVVDLIEKERILEQLKECLKFIGTIAKTLDVDLKIDIDIDFRRKTNIESLIIALNYDILRFNRIDSLYFNRRRLKEVILPQFLNIVYELGFNMDDLKEAYFKKMQSNYNNTKFNKGRF